MQKRAVRTVVLVVLLAVGAGAALEIRGVQRQIDTLESEYADLSNRIERLSSAITFIAAAQHTYIGSGQPDELSLNRVSVLVQQIAGDSAALRGRIRGANSPSHMQAFADGLSGLIRAEERAREDLGQGQALAAADALLREPRDSVATMDAKLREVRYGEAALFDANRAALEGRSWLVLGAVALLWAAGLVLFARVPASHTVEVQASPAAPAAPADEGRTAEPAVNLAAASEVCASIARMTDASSLRAVLARSADAIGARGLVLWMGAGEELFAAAAHGYDDHLVARLGPIGRSADNATAAAWRSGEVTVVHGAVVAPLPGPGGCIGALAAEVPAGTEAHAATRAVTSMIAAQLATVLSAWPAASAAEPESERHAAAS